MAMGRTVSAIRQTVMENRGTVSTAVDCHEKSLNCKYAGQTFFQITDFNPIKPHFTTRNNLRDEVGLFVQSFLQINRNNIINIFKFFQSLNVLLFYMMVDSEHHNGITTNC